VAELEQELGLRIDSALQAVAQLDRALTQVATDAGEAIESALAQAVQIDASPIETAITGAVEEADTDVAVGEVDAEVVTETIGEATDAADTAVTVEEADADVVTETITSAVTDADTDVTVEHADAEVVRDTIEAAISESDTTIVVEADTSQVEEALSGVSTQSDDAAESLAGIGEQASEAAGGFTRTSEAATITSGALAVTSGNFAGLASKAGPAGAAVAGVGALLGVFVSSALEAQEVTARFEDVFGDLAPVIEKVDIGGLNMTIAELSVQLGASDDALRSAVTTFGQLGIASGATRAEVAETAEQLIALSAGVSALNPTLGSADELIGGLTNSLARGGRSLAQYGITLTSTEIEARALADTGKRTSAELTQFEKATAGAALATERFGDTLGTAVAEGAEKTSIKLRAFRTQIGETIEGLGAPLIEPVMELFEAAGPAIEGTVRLIGVALRLLTPLIEEVSRTFELLSPIIRGVGTGLEFVLNLFGDTKDKAEEASGALEEMPPGLSNITSAVEEAIPAIDRLTTDSLAALSEEMQAVVKTVEESAPGIAGAFARLAESTVTSLMEIQVALVEQIRAEREFFGNVATIAEQGGKALAEELLSQGVERGAAGAKAIADSGPLQIQATEKLAQELIGVNEAAGLRIGAALTGGMIGGIRDQANAVIAETKKLVDQAAFAARLSLGMRSPSKVFAEIGESIGEGMALGIRSSMPAVGRAIGELERFTVGGGGTVNVTAGAPTIGGGAVSQNITVVAAQDPEATAQRVSLRVLQGAQR
jgi:hypothetical protein